MQLADLTGWPALVAIAYALLIFLAYLTWQRRKRRRLLLLEKYGDPNIVERILQRMYWQNQTAEQLRDSLGTPVDIDHHVLKSTTRETWWSLHRATQAPAPPRTDCTNSWHHVGSRQPRPEHHTGTGCSGSAAHPTAIPTQNRHFRCCQNSRRTISSATPSAGTPRPFASSPPPQCE